MSNQTRALEAQATAILKNNPEPRAPAVRVRYRGGRPAMAWLAKKDAEAAAYLWRIARERLPLEAANDNEPAKGLGVDRRESGKPRGKNPAPRSLEAHLAIPGIQPRLGDADAPAAITGNWDAEARGLTIKPQRPDLPFHPDCIFGYCAPAIATGAIFLGSIGGLGQTKAGKLRGDARRVDEPAAPKLPENVEIVIETILSGGDVADVGIALGARGGYADRRGGKALIEAANWAKTELAASYVPNRGRQNLIRQ